jgi:hypothetical protein
VPVGYELVAKTTHFSEVKMRKEKRQSPVTKNEYCRRLLAQAVQNHIPFRYVITDLWYASAENIKFVKHDLKKDVVMPLKSNRKAALSLADKHKGRYVHIDTLDYQEYPVRDVYHKSLKQNGSLSKSPTQTVTTQANHFFAALCAYTKLEMLSVSKKLNHTALKSKLYISALQRAFEKT